MAIVLMIVGVAIQASEPGTKASGAEIASYFAEHKTQVTVSTILFGISAALLVLFGARLRERWREQAPEHGTLSLVVFGGGVATAAGLAFGCAVMYTLVDVAPHASPQTLQALNALIAGSPLYFTIGLAIMVAGISALAIVGRVLPAWLGWIGGLLAISLLIPGGSPAGPKGASGCWWSACCFIAAAGCAPAAWQWASAMRRGRRGSSTSSTWRSPVWATSGKWRLGEGDQTLVHGSKPYAEPYLMDAMNNARRHLDRGGYKHPPRLWDWSRTPSDGAGPRSVHVHRGSRVQTARGPHAV